VERSPKAVLGVLRVLIDVLRDLFAIRGVSQHIRSDNGAAFIANAIKTWLTSAQVETATFAVA
jgi:hypothetical protein